MINKKLIFISIFIIGLLAVSAVSASDLDSTDEIAVDEDISDNIIVSDSELISKDSNDVPSVSDVDEDNALYGNLKIKEESNLSDSISVSGNTFEDIQNAIDSANEGDTIKLSGTYTGNGVQINITKPLTILGTGETILDANGRSRIFYTIYDNVNLKNLKLINGKFSSYSNTYGGSVFLNGSNCSVVDCSFVNSSAITNSQSWGERSYGGSVFLNGSHCSVVGCSFVNSSARVSDFSDYGFSSGGAVYASGIVSVLDCSFMNNTADEGGAIYGNDNLSVLNCSFVNSSGRTIYFYEYAYSPANVFCVKNCSFVNTDGISGCCGDCSVLGCSFVNCSLIGEYNPYYGGAVYLRDSSASIVDSSFVNCSAGSTGDEGYGGAIYCYRIDGILSGCTFDNNHAGNGGAIYIDNGQFASYNMHNFTIADNDYKSNAPNVYEGLVSFADNVLSINTTDLSGNITVKINNKVLSEKISSSKTSFALDGFSKGVFNANIHYFGDDEYAESYLTIPVFIESSYSLTASDLTKYYGGSDKLTVKLSNNNNAVSGAKVKVAVNGKESSLTTDSKGQASLDINLAPGTYNAVCEYEGLSASSKITVKSTVTVADSKGTYLNSKVSATFLDTAGKALASTKVSFKVGSKTYTATTNSNGVATANVDLGVGTYNVTAINPKNNEQKTSKLTISKAKSSMTLSATSNNDAVTLTASLSPSTASGNVIFYIDDKNYSAKITSSKASKTITGLNVGNYTVIAFYAGDSNLNSSTAFTNVEVKKVIVTKIIYNDMYTGPVPKGAGRIGNYFCVKLVDDKNNPLAGLPMEIGFNGRIYNKTTDSNGYARLQINLGYEGAYTFAIGFLGDDERGAAFEVAKIKVSNSYPKPNKANATSSGYELNTSQSKTKIKTSIDYNNMNTKSVIKVEGRAGDDFVVTLLDNNKKPLANMPVKIGFNGVIYDKTTDSSGKAQLKINLLYPNTYTFAICYLGDSKYQASFVVAKIKVTNQTPKLTSSSKTFKSSAKTKSLSATLVSMRGKAISGQKVKFTVNGKTYTGKTNANGVATVNISLNKKGTYSCTVKFAGMTGVSAKTTKTSVKIS